MHGHIGGARKFGAGATERGEGDNIAWKPGLLPPQSTTIHTGMLCRLIMQGAFSEGEGLEDFACDAWHDLHRMTLTSQRGTDGLLRFVACLMCIRSGWTGWMISEMVSEA